ncbi:MAG: pentapeptide repeat-containing protein [Cyanobacteria bacterium P01_C01_bin.89]
MGVLKGFWDFLNTDVKALPWGEFADKGIAATLAAKDAGKALAEQGPKLEALAPYVKDMEPFLKALDAPVTQLAFSGLPFLSVGVGLLRFYRSQGATPLSYEEAVAIAAQLAYLSSLDGVLRRIEDEAVKEKLEQVSLRKVIEKQLKDLDSTVLGTEEAKRATVEFRGSVLARQFGEALTELLEQAGVGAGPARRLADEVAWGTPRYLHQAIAEAGDSVAVLAEIYRTGGQKEQEQYANLDRYLEEKIDPLPDEQVFDERDPLVRFRDVYVPLQVQPLTEAGEVNRDVEPLCIHRWASGILEQWDERQPRKVLFVEGDAGRGKSVFCRMFPKVVRRRFGDAWIPLVIRLRNLRTLANNLTETLEDCPELEQWDFVRSDSGWLSDRSTRFLIVLDGFDELLLEGRTTGGLKEFLSQVAQFQRNSHHQCIVTGRPLALQGVERSITQEKDRLARVRLEPMTDELRGRWLDKWGELFGEEEVEGFRKFLEVCPNDIGNGLAREPLLLYLLARLFREKRLHSEMFTEIEGGENTPIKAKLVVYRESMNWVLEKQRQDQNQRLSGLELEDLREVLQEAALCVVQSGNETARLEMVKHRFQGTGNPVAQLLQEAQEETGQDEKKALNNLLTTFYLKPGEGDRQGSVEFAHKSFGEYLFAERLLRAFEDWTEQDQRRRRFRMDERAVYEQVYDLLGYGGLSQEIMGYVFELLAEREIDRVKLFGRLEQFYWRWCDGEFLDQPPSDNLPQKKMLQLQEQEVDVGLKPVDISTGLNILILLFKLHAEAQLDGYPFLPKDAPKPSINFHPCGQPDTDAFRPFQLLNIVHYADSLGQGTFAQRVGPHLNSANLNSADLYRADLNSADLNSAYLNSANLNSANLNSAYLYRADLNSANLNSANLNSADLNSANLNSANLNRANLNRANLNSANLNRANLNSADLNSADLYRADLYRADLNSAYLYRADLYRADLNSANLNSANLNSALLLETDLRGVTGLTDGQLTGDSPPIMGGVYLPSTVTVDPNRDWEKLPAVMRDRYPDAFETLEAAEEWVQKRREGKDT